MVDFLKKISLIILLLLNFLSVTSQQYQYFNNRYDLSALNNYEESFNILETSDGYVVAGNSIVLGEYIYWWDNLIAKLNYAGEVQYINYFGEDSIDYFFPSNSGFIISDSNRFYAVGIKRTPTSDWVHDQAILFNLDINLDTIFTKAYGECCEPFDTAYRFSCLVKIKENNLILGGGWKPYGLATHAYLMKTDDSGQFLWAHSYSYGNQYIEILSVSQTSDSGFILGCVAQTIGYPYTVDPIMIKTDSLGNQEWTKNLGGPFKEFPPMISLSKDGNIIVGSSYADTMYTPDIPLSRINIIKLDNDGNIIWNRKYGDSQPSNFLRNIRTLNDGSIITVGTVRKFNPAPERVGWIFKTDSNGDSLWYREYLFLPGQESSNYLCDVIPTSDNGLIACGIVDPSLPDTGSVDTWVIKLDSIGCEWAGCDTTVGIQDDKTVGLYDGKRGGLEIWPNPAREILNFKFSILNSGRDYSISIYDIFSRLVLSSTPIIPPSGGTRGGPEEGWQWQINVEAFPPGVYIAILKKGFDLVESRKFVVAR
jgi:hypothetical protein